MTLYVDYASSRPPLTQVKAVGYAGIMRYLSWLPNPKVITSTEYLEALSLVLGVRLVWEYNSDDPRQGASLGAQHGAEASRQARLLGYPTTQPIYFAADYDCQPGDWIAVEAYLRAARLDYPVGLYGPAGVVDAMLQRGAITAGWQAGGATSWYDNNRVSQLAHWYQRGTPTLGSPGGSVDENVQLRPDLHAPDPGEHMRQALPTTAHPVKTASGSWGGQQYDVVITGNDGIVYHIWYVVGVGWQGPEDLTKAG